MDSGAGCGLIALFLFICVWIAGIFTGGPYQGWLILLAAISIGFLVAGGIVEMRTGGGGLLAAAGMLPILPAVLLGVANAMATEPPITSEEMVAEFEEHLMANYDRYVAEGLGFQDSDGVMGGRMMEIVSTEISCEKMITGEKRFNCLATVEYLVSNGTTQTFVDCHRWTPSTGRVEPLDFAETCHQFIGAGGS